MHSAKHWMSILFGLALLVLGVLPILSLLGVIGVPFDNWLGSVAFLFGFVAAFAGLYLIIDSFHEIAFMPGIGWTTLIVGFGVLAFGTIQVLVTSPHFGVLNWEWWPDVPDVFFYALFILEGILLFIAGFLD